ncbi:MAG: acyl carrier protein [Eubacteriaceae bacterium]|jgi:acyl carrier protein
MLDKIKAVLVESVNADENLITPEASLKEDLGLDSLEALELSMELETEFDITIEDEELEALITVQDIMDLIAKKQAE